MTDVFFSFQELDRLDPDVFDEMTLICLMIS